jgi:hypothetical protein
VRSTVLRAVAEEHRAAHPPQRVDAVSPRRLVA